MSLCCLFNFLLNPQNRANNNEVQSTHVLKVRLFNKTKNFEQFNGLAKSCIRKLSSFGIMTAEMTRRRESRSVCKW